MELSGRQVVPGIWGLAGKTLGSCGMGRGWGANPETSRGEAWGEREPGAPWRGRTAKTVG